MDWQKRLFPRLGKVVRTYATYLVDRFVKKPIETHVEPHIRGEVNASLDMEDLKADRQDS